MTVAKQLPNRLANWRRDSAEPKPSRRVKTPTVLQMEAVECGAAALAIVMEHYGKIVPLEQLRVACGVSRNGSKAGNIARAAREYGFKVVGRKRAPEKLLTTKMPVIVHWNFNHFLVVEGFGKNTVYLNDPATGPRTVTFDEFDSSFTGVTLMIEPDTGFTRSGRRPSLLAALRERLVGSGSAVAYLIFVSLFLTLLGLVIPSFTRAFIDQFLVGGLTSWVLPLLLAMGGTALLVALLTWLQQQYLLRLELKLAIASSGRFFWHVLRLPIDFFHQRRAADISNRVGLNDSIAQLLSGEVATSLINVALIVFYGALMIRYDVVLTAVGVTFALLNLIALRYFSRRRKDANQRLLNEQGSFMAVAFSGLQMMETLKATGRESDFFTRWSGTQAKAVNAEQELGITTQLLTTVPGILATVNIAVIVTLGGLRIVSGQLTIGELMAFQALVASFMLPVNQIVNLGSRLQQTQGEMTRLDDVLQYPVDQLAAAARDDEAVDADATKLIGHVELRNVTFGYSKLEPPLLENISLTFKPGARVALVGGSGSGKSTIAKLVAGVYEPWSGAILFDGQPREAIAKTQMKNSLAMVDQDIYLYEGTVRENITMWDQTVPETHVIQAAKDAAIHDNIASRQGGYDFIVAEGGANFSGGQRQRVEIARALVNNPTILVMDEATSALDPVTEKVIDDNIRRRGCTTLIVAHRLSTIRDCDEIIVLENGKIVQRGTHDRMLRMDGPYARLIRSQDASKTTTQDIFDLLTAETA